MLLHPGRLGQDPCAQAESGVVLCGLGVIGGLDHVGVAALHGRRDERVTVWEVQVHRGGGYRHRACDRAQGQGLVVGQVAEHLHGGGGDLLPQPSPCPRALGRRGPPGGLPGWCRPSPGHSSFTCLRGARL